LLAGDIPSPLKNESVFQLVSHEFFAKKLPLDGGFMWEKQRKKRWGLIEFSIYLD
jgi:hypothetical protein